MVEKSSNFIENKCTHHTIRLVLNGKKPITKEILNMLDLGQIAIANNFNCFFASKI